MSDHRDRGIDTLAHQMDISENRLSLIVQGWVEPSPREQTAIAAALGKRAEELSSGRVEA